LIFLRGKKERGREGETKKSAGVVPRRAPYPIPALDEKKKGKRGGRN